MAPKINVKERYNDGEVDLSMSELREVPVKDILALKRVHNLDLSNNSLRVLPKNFSNLTNISVLDLSRNELKELPEDFGNLIKLRHLDLYRNQLQQMPLSFSKLKSLKWLDLKDNPLVPAVAKVAGLCSDTKACQTCAKNVVHFYARLESQVAAELEMRNKDRQRTLEFNQKKKQEEKKLKKKEKQKGKKVVNMKYEEPKMFEGENLNHKVENDKSSKKDQKSGSCVGTLFKLLFLVFSVYFAFIFVKVYESENAFDSARELVLSDYSKALHFSQVWGQWFRQNAEWMYKQFVDKYL